ncbi:MAG: hypothetical protein K2M83_12365, partial [Muribaculaceae bacterium]|nr:hypothetical protein [Muribaculaceae bacterium]
PGWEHPILLTSPKELDMFIYFSELLIILMQIYIKQSIYPNFPTIIFLKSKNSHARSSNADRA